MYSKKILSRFQKPKFARKMEDADASGKVGNIKCGDIMEVFIKVGKNKKGEEIIKDISFLTYGCVAAIASSDVLCELVKGKTLKEAEKITGKDVVKVLGEVPPIKIHCSVLAQDALRKAIESYKKKKN